MEWLHFSDFHFGGKIGPQHEAMGSLIDYIRSEFKSNPGTIDAVFLVGDIAYSGQEVEYDRFEKAFLNPLLNIPSVRGAKVFVVPGNHDLDCDASNPITWEGIKERNQQIFFCENEEGGKVRKPRSDVFRYYWDFVQRNKIVGPNPFEEISILCQEATFPFDIIAVNTSFFCDKDEKSDDPITPCPLGSLRERLKGFERNRPLIILGHHPMNCFLKTQQLQFESLLVDNNAVYLHGHEHEPKVSHNADGTGRTL